ncbi:hypothetical protein ACLBXB_21180 [Methylobacterium mesophilicum]
MPELFVTYSHKCSTALATILKLIREAGFSTKLILAMPSDRASTDGGAFEEAIRQAKAYEIPEHLSGWLVVLNSTMTLSHDVGVGFFRANDDAKVVFALKHFLDTIGFSYVITHVDTGLTISDLSGVTEFDHAA